MDACAREETGGRAYAAVKSGERRRSDFGWVGVGLRGVVGLEVGNAFGSSASGGGWGVDVVEAGL